MHTRSEQCGIRRKFAWRATARRLGLRQARIVDRLRCGRAARSPPGECGGIE
jgi:hypothetical protein